MSFAPPYWLSLIVQLLRYSKAGENKWAQFYRFANIPTHAFRQLYNEVLDTWFWSVQSFLCHCFKCLIPGNESALMRRCTIVPAYHSYGTTRAGQWVNYPSIQSTSQRHREQMLTFIRECFCVRDLIVTSLLSMQLWSRTTWITKKDNGGICI